MTKLATERKIAIIAVCSSRSKAEKLSASTPGSWIVAVDRYTFNVCMYK